MKFDRTTKEGQAAYSRHWRAQNKLHYDEWRKQRYQERKDEINAIRRAKAAKNRTENPKPPRSKMTAQDRKEKRRARYLENREQELIRDAIYREANRAEIYAKAKAKRDADPSYHRKHNKKYRDANPDKNAARRAAYRAAQLQATPAWANMAIIGRTYETASMMTKAGDDVWSVDHMIALQADDICGLHVENNLQLMILSENQSKGNNWKQYVDPAHLW